MRSEFAQTELETTCVGFLPPVQLRGPLNWRENVAYARVRSRATGKRYRVWAVEINGRNGERTWSWGGAPYPDDDSRSGVILIAVTQEEVDRATQGA